MVQSFKNGALGISGQAILGAYFIVGTFSKMLAFLSLSWSIRRLDFIVPDADALVFFKRFAIFFASTIAPVCLHFVGSIILQGYLFRDYREVQGDGLRLRLGDSCKASFLGNFTCHHITTCFTFLVSNLNPV